MEEFEFGVVELGILTYYMADNATGHGVCVYCIRE